MKNGNILLSRFDPRAKRQVSQDIHDFGDIDVIWASNAAGIAGGADPDGLRREDPLSVAVLDMAEHLIGENIHRFDNRTSRRTLLTLKTGLNFFAAGLSNFIQERTLQPVLLHVLIHSLPLKLGGKDFPGSSDSPDEWEAQS